MSNVDLNFNEDVECVSYHHVAYREQATVTIMHEKVRLKRTRPEVIDAACTVRDVTMNHTLCLTVVRKNIANE